MVADGETGAHFDMAYFSVVQQCLFETLAVCQQVFGFLAQGMPDGIQWQLVTDTVEQAHFIGVLKVQQGFTGGGLGHVQALGRPGDILVFGYCQEYL